jgi:hypothetical protein
VKSSSSAIGTSDHKSCLPPTSPSHVKRGQVNGYGRAAFQEEAAMVKRVLKSRWMQRVRSQLAAVMDDLMQVFSHLPYNG